jgi:hypothetical protein
MMRLGSSVDGSIISDCKQPLASVLGNTASRSPDFESCEKQAGLFDDAVPAREDAGSDGDRPTAA